MQVPLFELVLKRLRKLRLEQGLTQEAFAEKAQISYKYYQAIEEGRKKDLRLSTLDKLARAHEISLSRFLDFERERSIALVSEKNTPYRAKPKKKRA